MLPKIGSNREIDRIIWESILGSNIVLALSVEERLNHFKCKSNTANGSEEKEEVISNNSINDYADKNNVENENKAEQNYKELVEVFGRGLKKFSIMRVVKDESLKEIVANVDLNKGKTEATGEAIIKDRFSRKKYTCKISDEGGLGYNDLIKISHLGEALVEKVVKITKGDAEQLRHGIMKNIAKRYVLNEEDIIKCGDKVIDVIKKDA